MENLTENYIAQSGKRALKLYGNRVQLAENVRRSHGQETSYERKLLTAQCLDNTQRQIKVMESINTGATQSSNIGQYKRYSIGVS